jgi:glycosyltransferase involved in cell wall biosynthesis
VVVQLREDIKNSRKYAAVIPAYNPGKVVINVVSEVGKNVDLVVLVDDGCDSENKAFLEQCTHMNNVRLLSFAENRGKGYALISGLKEALKNSPDYIFTIDSDGQHDPKSILKFKEFVAYINPPTDLIIGVRNTISKSPLRSKIGNVFTANLFNFIFRKTLVDTQSGFRLLSADFAKSVISNVRPGRYETEMNMLVYAVDSNRNITDIGIDAIYIDNNKNSKFRPFQDSLLVLLPLFKYAWIALISFFLDYSIFLILCYLLGVYYLIAHCSARLCSATFNFFSNKHWVFQSNDKVHSEGIRYIVAVLFTLTITAFLLFLFVGVGGISRAMAKPMAEFIMFILNFVVLNKFVFANRLVQDKFLTETSNR